jgi:predicted SprT family Zn-dependent metalloprotease
LSELGELWGLQDLEARVTVSFSDRFRSSLGRCVPATGEVRLASFLKAASSGLLREALCHEAAHAAVYQIHGARARPHGQEWRDLMRVAGFEPRARVPASVLEGLAPKRRANSATWQHRCPVCRATRIARTAVPRWRCAVCLADGLDGDLVITRIPALGEPNRDRAREPHPLLAVREACRRIARGMRSESEK